MVYGNQGVIKGKNQAFPEDVKLFATFSATSFALMCYFKTNVKFYRKLCFDRNVIFGAFPVVVQRVPEGCFLMGKSMTN